MNCIIFAWWREVQLGKYQQAEETDRYLMSQKLTTTSLPQVSILPACKQVSLTRALILMILFSYPVSTIQSNTTVSSHWRVQTLIWLVITFTLIWLDITFSCQVWTYMSALFLNNLTSLDKRAWQMKLLENVSNLVEYVFIRCSHNWNCSLQLLL